MGTPSKQGAAPTKRSHSSPNSPYQKKYPKNQKKAPPPPSWNPNIVPSQTALPIVTTHKKVKAPSPPMAPPSHHHSSSGTPSDPFGPFYPVPPMMYQQSSTFSEMSLPFPHFQHSRSFGSYEYPSMQPTSYGAPPNLQYVHSQGQRPSLLDTPASDLQEHFQFPSPMASKTIVRNPKTNSDLKKDRDVAASALLDLPTTVTSRPPLVEHSNAKSPSTTVPVIVKKQPQLPPEIYKRARNPLVAERAMRLLEHAIPTNMACKCKNTACLKLYCSCFQTGALCDASLCSCTGCNNTESHSVAQGTRTRAVFEILNRRVDAFEPRLRKKTGQGCACKKNKCLRKYCDCFATGKTCFTTCSCEACENRPAAASARARISKVNPPMAGTKIQL